MASWPSEMLNRSSVTFQPFKRATVEPRCVQEAREKGSIPGQSTAYSQRIVHRLWDKCKLFDWLFLTVKKQKAPSPTPALLPFEQAECC